MRSPFVLVRAFALACVALPAATLCVTLAGGQTMPAPPAPPPAAAPLPDGMRDDALPRAHARIYDGPPLSLPEAQAEAVARHPELRAMTLDAEAAGHRPAQERSLPPPSLEAQIWQWPIDSLNPRETGMYMLSASQTLPGRGKRALRAAVAERAAEAAGADVETRRQALLNEVAATYAELVLLRATLDALDQDADLLRTIADAAAIAYANGRADQADPLRAAAALSSHHDSILSLTEQLLVTSGQLNTLMHRLPEAPIGPLAPAVERAVAASLPVLQALAAAHHPQAAAARRREAQADADQAASAAEHRPDFAVMGGYMLTPSGRDAWMGSIGVTWPNAPWSRPRLDARDAEAATRARAARAEEEMTLARVRAAVFDAYTRATHAASRAAALRTSLLPQTDTALEAARVAYETRGGPLAAALEAQRLRLDTRLRYGRALRDLDRARADLAQAIGGAPLDATTMAPPAVGIDADVDARTSGDANARGGSSFSSKVTHGAGATAASAAAAAPASATVIAPTRVVGRTRKD